MANYPKCSADQYRKPETNDKSNRDDDLDQKGPPVKVLHQFPMLPGLRHLFANKNDAKLMRWHAEGRKMIENYDTPQMLFSGVTLTGSTGNLVMRSET